MADYLERFLGFFQAFKDSFMQRALISSIIIGVVCSVIGVFVLLRGMVFLGQAIAHSSFAGATLAILLNVQPTLIILGFSVVSSVIIGYVNQKRLMKDEVIIPPPTDVETAKKRLKSKEFKCYDWWLCHKKI